MTERHDVLMGLDGKKIDVHITATSEEQAQRFYEAIESALMQGARIELENQWNRGQEVCTP